MAITSNQPNQPDAATNGTQNRANLVQTLVNHDALFHDIDNNHPEGDVRQRFMRLRAIRAHYFEGLLMEIDAKLKNFKDEILSGKKRPEDSKVQREYRQLMGRLDSLLNLNSRALEQDSKAAQAPLVEPYFMDHVFRYHMEPPYRGSTAPNGELKTFYGSCGDPVGPQFTTLRDIENDLFRRLITEKLMQPLNQRVYVPMLAWYRKLLRRPAQNDDQGLDGGTLDLMVSALECMFAIACLAGTVALLHTLKSWKYSLIAAAFLNLLFLYSLLFLSKAAVKVFTVTTAFWAVMVVFIASSTYGPNNCDC